jgi:hypothetical protein
MSAEAQRAAEAFDDLGDGGLLVRHGSKTAIGSSAGSLLEGLRSSSRMRRRHSNICSSAPRTAHRNQRG